jgi:eukaryotic-like serine/threonine-protein kinase
VLIAAGQVQKALGRAFSFGGVTYRYVRAPLLSASTAASALAAMIEFCHFESLREAVVDERDGSAKIRNSAKSESRNDKGVPSAISLDATLDLSTSSAAGQVIGSGIQAIGPYRLIRKLGQGGMGQVWLAEQTEPLRRQVALKLIKLGLHDDSALQRFQSERQSLALMEHPSIAKVFDAGATVDGQPYFVMEYVPGLSITDYCDQKKLKIRERLELFVKVCEGVQHAHQKAIMHRDLKPANILVVEVDGRPVPRIIDFGLAKAATLQIGDETLLTKLDGWVGTPGYMSPEQADPSLVDVDTRTDVYSLGAVLYVLLTGFLPFEMKDWRKQRYDEFLRHLREEDPPCPSAKLSKEKEASRPKAEARGCEPQHLVSLLHGDLDWITMKALEKNRARRYGTPSELAADICRYLNHEPVAARPASTGYHLQKYVRRHRMGVTMAAGLVLLLASFAGMQAVQLRRITRERDRANRITDFMTNMFKVSDPSEARGNNITAREILDKASKDIDTGLAKDPDLNAQMTSTMAGVYKNLGLYPRARSLLERAIEIQRRILGPEDPNTLRSLSTLGYVLEEEGHYVEAEKLERQALDSQRRVLGPEHADTLTSMNNLSRILDQEGRYAEAEKLERHTLEIERPRFGPDHSDTVRAMNNLAITLYNEGHFAEAEKLDREMLGIRQRVLGPEHPDTLRMMTNLAAALYSEGEVGQAEKLDRQTLEIERRILGPEHPDTVRTMNNLSNALLDERLYPEAEDLARQTLDIRRRILGPDSPETFTYLENLAIKASYNKRYAEATDLFREAIERAAKSPEPSVLSDAWYAFGCGAAISGHHDEALQYLRQAIDKGYADANGMAADKDLESLRSDPRFQSLIVEIRQHAKEQ